MRPGRVLLDMGLPASRIRRIAQNRNTHWLADTPAGRIVLRRFAAERSRESVIYELRIIEHLAQRGWPVAEPVAPMFELDGALWSASRYLPGRTSKPRSWAGKLAEQRRRGRLLARLHADLAELAVIGQRDGWLRADEGLLARPGQSPVGETLRRFERICPEQAQVLLSYAERAHERLRELLPHAPAPIVIHGDFTPWNLKYQHGALTGILDFEMAHLDLRVADFALSWRGQYKEILRGYDEVAPLEPVERALILPIYWIWLIGSAVGGLDAGATRTDWEVSHLLRTNDVRLKDGFPSL